MKTAGPFFVGGDIYRRPGFGANHPLAIPRVGLVLEICEAMSWLDENYLDSPMADDKALLRFHDRDYLEAVKRVAMAGRAEENDRVRYQLGTMENPVFEGLEQRARTTCGGSILAAEKALAGCVAFNPAGGTHHGMPDHAHGFCYFNDPVMAIMTLLDGGAGSIFYLDLDAHHGDGVEAAFLDEPRVVTLSIHERARWPGTGTAHGGRGAGAYNYPVPKGFNDCELAALMSGAVLPMIEELKPDVAVITCGADALAGDPLSGMMLSNVALWDAVTAVTERVPGAVVLGGGGYNPWTVARCWSGLWGRLSGRTPPWPVPEKIKVRFDEIECDLVDEEDIDQAWRERLDDAPNKAPVREEVAALIGDTGSDWREVV
ncbi:acetoin utilization protein AcuC [Thalassospiraceae bacterium LMO-JJ14]|nr:acetoin utilization protein AcuC [Thalassospiraceae bacterium LMO-JJ14]